MGGTCDCVELISSSRFGLESPLQPYPQVWPRLHVDIVHLKKTSLRGFLTPPFPLPHLCAPPLLEFPSHFSIASPAPGSRPAPRSPRTSGLYFAREKAGSLRSGAESCAECSLADQCLSVHLWAPAPTPHLPWDPATLPAPAPAPAPPQYPHSPASPSSGAHAPPTAVSPNSGLPRQAQAGSGPCARCPASSGASLGRSARFQWPTATEHGFAGQWRLLAGLGCSAGAEAGPALTIPRSSLLPTDTQDDSHQACSPASFASGPGTACADLPLRGQTGPPCTGQPPFGVPLLGAPCGASAPSPFFDPSPKALLQPLRPILRSSYDTRLSASSGPGIFTPSFTHCSRTLSCLHLPKFTVEIRC